MTDVVKAPWTLNQIRRLRLRQQNGALHPYTCPAHSMVSLEPTPAGWVCPLGGCGYTQDWAHTADVYGRMP